MYNIQHSKNLIKEEESWVTREPVLNIYLRYLPHLQLQGCLEHSMLLMAGRSGYLIPGGARFCPPIQTEPWVKWVQVSSRGVKRPDLGWRLPSTSSSTEAKKRVELKLFSPSEPSWPVLGWTLLFIFLSPNFRVGVGVWGLFQTPKKSENPRIIDLPSKIFIVYIGIGEYYGILVILICVLC